MEEAGTHWMRGRRHPANRVGNKSVSIVKYASGENGQAPAQSGRKPGTNVPRQPSVGRYRKIVSAAEQTRVRKIENKLYACFFT